ncbi:uncharacterized protein LOC144452263 [Glandiceps talaboti]
MQLTTLPVLFSGILLICTATIPSSMLFGGAWIATIIVSFCASTAARVRFFASSENYSPTIQTVNTYESIAMSNLSPVSMATERSTMNSSTGFRNVQMQHSLHELTTPVDLESRASLQHSIQQKQYSQMSAIQQTSVHGVPGTSIMYSDTVDTNPILNTQRSGIESLTYSYRRKEGSTLTPGESVINAGKSVFRQLFSPTSSVIDMSVSPDIMLESGFLNTYTKVYNASPAILYAKINQSQSLNLSDDIFQPTAICKMCRTTEVRSYHGVTSTVLEPSETQIGLPTITHSLSHSVIRTPQLITSAPTSTLPYTVDFSTTGVILSENNNNEMTKTMRNLSTAHLHDLVNSISAMGITTTRENIHKTAYHSKTTSLSSSEVNAMHSWLHTIEASETIQTKLSSHTHNLSFLSLESLASTVILNSGITLSNIATEFISSPTAHFLRQSIQPTASISSPTEAVSVVNKSEQGGNGKTNKHGIDGFSRSYITVHSSLDSVNILMPALVFVSLVAVAVKLIQHCRRHSRQAKLRLRRTQTSRQTTTHRKENVKVDSSKEMVDRNNDFMKEMSYMYQRHHLHPPCHCHCSCSHLTHSGSRHQLLHSKSREEPLAQSLAQNLDANEESDVEAQVTKL